MTAPLREVDDEFADFVRARQHELLRAAYLVCGDEQRAERLVREAFTTLWVSWRTLGDEDLDAFVRRVLYRALTARAGRRSSASDPSAERPRSAVEVALAALAPRQRAVIVLRHVERRSQHDAAAALGLSTRGVAAHESAALRRLDALLPGVGASPPGARVADLERVLDAAAEHLTERDLVAPAREGARSIRERRRRAGATALAVATAVVVGVVVIPWGPDGSDRPTTFRPSQPPQPVVGAEWDPSEVDVLGVPAQVGPTARQLADLPRVPDATRGQLALPDVLAFGPDTRMPDLSAVGGSGAPVRAVLLRHTAQGLRAVLVRPTLANPYVLVDTVPLVPTLDEGGTSADPLEVTAIADDRRHVMFLQPGKVHVLDAFTATVRSFTVPDRHLHEGGWVGREVNVWSQTYRWRVSPDTGQVRRLGQAVYHGPHRVTATADDLRIQGYDDRGTGSASRTGPGLLSGTWGATFSNDEDRLATGGFLSQPAALELNRQRPMRLFQGVLTLDARQLTGARLLVAPGSEGVAVGCCEVLGWAYKDEILVRWRITDLLMWNARTGALLRVSTLPGRQQEPPVLGSPAASVAIAP
ncbi:sigma factor-like helix-turn-helix DNA-binding protein [Knoellia sp. CPCC 206435]|uniref:sigma factor-like helix-turn-helix DNA-binding protein n=1 Tax=Knoellia terrae TaxID=3404797 RepID=UPI003B42DF0F